MGSFQLEIISLKIKDLIEYEYYLMLGMHSATITNNEIIL